MVLCVCALIQSCLDVLPSAQDLWKDLHAFVSNTEVASQTPSDDPPSKRIKLDSDGKADGGETEGVPMVTAEPTADGTESSVCVVCLGVLQDFCNPSFTKKVCSFCDQCNESRLFALFICYFFFFLTSSFSFRNHYDVACNVNVLVCVCVCV